MVKIMNYEFKKVSPMKCATRTLRFDRFSRHLVAASVFVLSFIIYNSQFRIALAQQPQAPAGTPLYSVNAKYVNGMAPGYWPTAGSGLTLSLSAGTAYCGNPPAPVSYPGGSLALVASTTNYIYLNPANNCAPAVSTSAFSAGQIPIAKVVTGGSSITSIADARTWFQPQPCVAGSAGDLHCSSLGTSQNINLTPSGTGASVIANLQDKGGQVFNIKAYGAKGDGVTNDSPAFQAAYNAAVAAGGGIVYVPPIGSSGCYLLNDAINMTMDGARVTIEGSGGLGPIQSGSSGLICANTGGVLFDITNSHQKTFLNLDVTAQKSGLSNPSTVGIFSGRIATGQSGQFEHIQNCVFSMPLHYSGTTYSFGVYLFGGEITFLSDDLLEADYPLVVTGTNNFNITSPFVTLGTGTYSETDVSFNNMELLSSGLGPAVYLYGVSDVNLSGHSWNFSQANPYPPGLYGYAIYIYNSHDIHIHGWRQEGFPGFALIDKGLYGSVIQGTHAPSPSPTTHAVEFNDASSEITNDDFRIFDELSTSSNWYYDATGGTPTGVAVLDNVSFYCGKENNCVNIPVGNYSTGATTYWSKIQWSGVGSNPSPAIRLDKGAYQLPVTGGFTIPTTAVPANSCSTLSLVSAAGAPALATIQMHPQTWYGLLVTASWGTGGFYPVLCNPTLSPITPASGIGATFKVVQ
ncbi:MAG TPA: glycosyl hydrolase family 28-related protein [Terriglobia bacterium]|nr:glycosyl hydrolase family 28-related protein [Terriglobia bacterium]